VSTGFYLMLCSKSRRLRVKLCFHVISVYEWYAYYAEFIAILGDIRVVGGVAVECPESGAMVACLFIDRCVGAGDYCVFSYGVAAWRWQQLWPGNRTRLHTVAMLQKNNVELLSPGLE
jgi:hypothetical protein